MKKVKKENAMPKQKDYIPRTYNMQYKDFSKILSQKKCNKQKDVRDMKNLKKMLQY